MKLVIGLGNIGLKYERTRHNIGFRVIENLAVRKEASFEKKKNLKAEICRLSAEDVLLVKPTTYMNESGSAVWEVLKYFKATTAEVLVVCDDTNLDFGVIRVRHGGSSGGHNGLKSIISTVGADFSRLRIGIKSTKLETTPLENFVLASFSTEEELRLPELINKSIKLVGEFVEDSSEHQTIR